MALSIIIKSGGDKLRYCTVKWYFKRERECVVSHYFHFCSRECWNKDASVSLPCFTFLKNNSTWFFQADSFHRKLYRKQIAVAQAHYDHLKYCAQTSRSTKLLKSFTKTCLSMSRSATKMWGFCPM